VFIHRWLAFAVLGMAVSVYLTARRPVLSGAEGLRVRREAQLSAFLLSSLVAFQILLGIGVVIFHVQIQLALFHQALALGLLAVNLHSLHRLRASDRAR